MPAACPCPAHAPSLSARPPFRGRSHDTWTAEWTDDEQSENFLHFASPNKLRSLHDRPTDRDSHCEGAR